MELIKSNINNVEDIMEIIKKAQLYFKEQGIDQWQNNYPNEESIKLDIKENQSYVLINKDEVIATAALTFQREDVYENIQNGKWLNNEDYAAIHRIAVDDSQKGKGIAGRMIEKLEKVCKDKSIYNIKVDTHEKNKSMQKLLKKSGFEYCGIIYQSEDEPRVAFQKILK